MRGYLALIRMNLKLSLRERAVLFFNYVFPLIFFFIFGSFMGGHGGNMTQVVTMVLVIGILGGGLFGAGIRAVAEREANILRRYKVAPITAAPILVASMVTGWILYLPSVVLVVGLSHILYGMPLPRGLISLLILVSVGSFAMRSIGLIVASVVNSVGESNIIIQILYMPMLFLSGATFPLSILPIWAQVAGQFLPASHLFNGMQGVMLRNETVATNWVAVAALLLTMVVALFISVKLFRWEKEEKIAGKAKLWILAVLLPFVVLGTYQAYSRENIARNKMFERDLRRTHSYLIRGARVLVGDGTVIENAGLLIRNGNIETIYQGSIPEAKDLKVDGLDAFGATVMPGLIDVHVHLGSPGGFLDPKDFEKDYASQKPMERALESYLYSGITAVKSVGDFLDKSLQVRNRFRSGEVLGADLFVCGPLFTAEGGHGTEYFKAVPEMLQKMASEQFLRIPKTEDEARKQVDELKANGVDGIKAVLESGSATMKFRRMDTKIFNAVAAESRADRLPIVVHTGDAADVADAVAAHVNGVEHGSARERIPDEVFVRMARDGIAYDPTLTVLDALQQFSEGKTDALDRTLVQKAVPIKLLDSTRARMNSPELANFRAMAKEFSAHIDVARDNLVRAWKAGVPLVTGTDAGNPLVFHGPTVQRELQLWVQAGIPANIAIQAATANGAKLLGIEKRAGYIRKGYEATLIVVDGNPLQDINVMERISSVFLKGERVDRGDLFDQQ